MSIALYSLKVWLLAILLTALMFWATMYTVPGSHHNNFLNFIGTVVLVLLFGMVFSFPVLFIFIGLLYFWRKKTPGERAKIYLAVCMGVLMFSGGFIFTHVFDIAPGLLLAFIFMFATVLAVLVVKFPGYRNIKIQKVK